jgi:hypothetical protein
MTAVSERICPHCCNPIYDDDALLCHFCGNSVGTGSSGAMGLMRGAGMKVFLTVLACLLVLGMILQMI